MITTHTQLLNAIIEKYSLKSYLEIGVRDRSVNFDKINCELKHGVDPECEWANDISNETSDSFFDRYYARANNRTQFQICFIDGLHHADQVKKDFENCLKQLPDHGFMVIHDVLPENEEGTLIPRQTRRWWGSTYQFAMNIGLYDNIEFKTFNIDEGCMVINKSKHTYIRPQYGNDWTSYLKYNRSAMNVVGEVVI